MRQGFQKITQIVKKAFERLPLLYAAAYFLFYFPTFLLLEKYVRPEYYIHCWLDDVIPFCEYFVIPYMLWFLFVPGLLFFFSLRSREDYWKCFKIVFGGMTICLALYWLFPNGLLLRGNVDNNNIFCAIVNFLRKNDTTTNVCPSIHVSSTVGIVLVLFRSEKLRAYKKLKAFSLVLGILICLSTMFLDQHSLVDVLCGIVLSTVLCGLIEQTEEEMPLVRQEEYLN